MYRDNDLEFLVSRIARSQAPAVGGNALTQYGMGPGAAQPQQETATASRHGRPGIEARLARLEKRLACAEASLASLKACRRYMELRLDRAFDFVSDGAGDGGWPGQMVTTRGLRGAAPVGSLEKKAKQAGKE